MKKRIAFLLAIILFFTCMPWSATPAAAAPEEKSPADDCKILDYVHEDVFEKADHLGRMEAEETLSNYVFLNKDGTRTAYYLDEAVKFVDTDGKIKEKDITLQSVLGGYATTQNDVTVTLPITMSSGVNLSYNNHQISLIPEGGTAGAPRIVNNAAEYVDFYGADTVLKYTPTLSGVKEDIILESYTGQNTFTFILNTNGLAVYHTKEDRYYLAPGKGTDPVYWLGALEIYDSALNMGTGTMTVEPMMAGQKYKITITVDTSWLTSTNTVYPVTVDPSITVNTNSGSNYIEDAPIYSGSSAIKGRNYGSNIYNCAGYMDSTYGEGRTVVRLKNLINNSTYINTPEERILSVKFYIADASNTTAFNRMIYPIVDNSTWTESNVTWNSVGDRYFSGNSSLTGAHAYASVGKCKYAAFDITSLVQKWKYGFYDANCGFMLIGSNTTSKSGALYSSEHSTTDKRPYVVFEYATNGYQSSFSGAGLFKNTPRETVGLYLDGLQTFANCYGYAMRIHMKYRASLGGYSQSPGEFARKDTGLTLSVSINGYYASATLEENVDLGWLTDDYIFAPGTDKEVCLEWIYQLMKADAEELGYTITKSSVSSIASSTTLTSQRMIALVASVSRGDYHFYMQHTDGTWSHKPGEGEPTNKCFCHQELLTNDTIDQHACSGIYDEENSNVVWYFLISKDIDNLVHVEGKDFHFTALDQ